MDEQLLKNVRVLVQEEKIDDAEKMILDYLDRNPKDSDAWIRLALVEMTPPYEDHRLIFEWMDKLLAYDPFNPYALLMLSYVHTYLFCGIPDDVYRRLCLAKNNDLEIMSMIELAKSWYFSSKNDWVNFEKSLRKSIEYCSFHQENLTSLGAFLLKKGEIEQGMKLIKHGMQNVKHICTSNDSCVTDPISMNDFLNEGFKGIFITQSNYETLEQLLERGMLLL